MSLQREIQQRRPFAAATQEATVALLRTADLVRKSVAAVTERYGLTPQQFNVLRILRGAGADGLPTLDIAARMIEEAPGITRLLDRLEAKNFVSRIRCERDRRQVFCRITDAGRSVLAALDEPLRESEDASLATLSERQLAQLIALLEKARTGLHATVHATRAEDHTENHTEALIP
jgi:DNA-binding MarR family transcriptional regulator